MALPVTALLFVVVAAVWLTVRLRSRPHPVPPEEAVRRLETSVRTRVRTTPGDPRPRVELVQLLLHQHRLSEALDLARDAHTAFPDSLPVTSALAEALFATARVTEAIDVSRKVAESGPDQRLQLVSYLVRSGRNEEALRQLKRLPKLSSRQAQLAANEYLDALDPAAAIPLLKGVVDYSPDSLELQTSYGLALLGAGRYGDAFPVLDRAAHRGGDVPMLHYYAGCAIRLSGNLKLLEDAEKHLSQAASLAPQEGLIQYELALSRAQLRNWEGARTAMERAAELLPENPEAQRDLARIHQRLHQPLPAALAHARYLRLVDDPEGAIRELQPWYQRQPDSAEVGLALSSAQYAARQFVPATAVLKRLQQKDPTRKDVLWALLRLHRNIQQWKEALEDADALEKVSSADPEVQSARADLLERTGRFPEEEKLLTTLRAGDPENPSRQLDLAKFLLLRSPTPDRLRIAEAALRAALRLKPEDPEARFSLGSLLLLQHQPKDALGELRKAIDQAPVYRDALRALGQVYLQLGDRSRSDDCFALLRREQDVADQELRLQAPVDQRVDLRRSRPALVRFYLEHSRLGRATEELEAAELLTPEDRGVHLQLERLYAHGRRFQRQLEERQTLGLMPARGRAAR